MTAPRPARIAHVALWTDDIDRLVRFYVSHFGAAAGERYVNAAKGFESRFLSFGEGARLEVMRSSTKDIAPRAPGVETN